MATKTVVCPECDSPLAPGRFSCSVCGALVASVATVSRSFSSADEYEAQPVAAEAASLPAEPSPPVPDVAAPVATAPAPVRKPRLPSAPSRRPKATHTAAATNGSNGSAPAGPPPMPVATPELMSWVLAETARPEPARVESPRVDLAGDQPPPASPVPSVIPAVSTAPAQPGVPTWPDRPVWPPVRNIDAVATPVEPATSRAPAGAYLPPSAVLPPAEALPLPGTARTDAAAPNAKGDGWASVSSSWRLRFGEDAGPLGLPADLPTRVVMLGAGLALLGFLMPWADVVIGSGSMDGYVARWGLAGPGHPMILLIVAGLFGLALIADRLPSWARLGLPSIGLAGLLIGLAWPYLTGPFDASVGVYVVAVGAILMIAGGLLDRTTSRHVEPAATV
jgi:hypothetical protein